MEVADLQVEPREIVKKIIQERDIKNRELSRLIDVAEQSMSKMLNGSRVLSDKTLSKLSKVLGVPFDMIKYGEGLDSYLTSLRSDQATHYGTQGGQAVPVTTQAAITEKDLQLKVLEEKVKYLERENEFLRGLLKGENRQSN